VIYAAITNVTVFGPGTSERLSLLFILLVFIVLHFTSTLLCFSSSLFFSPYLEVFLLLQGKPLTLFWLL
jgi:hypothetical protein